jgi:hypothetical protein
MRIVGIALAAFSMIVGFRLLVTAFQTAMSGKILVRQKGIKARWVPAQDMNEVWKIAFRDGLMGLLLIALGIALLT